MILALIVSTIIGVTMTVTVILAGRWFYGNVLYRPIKDAPHLVRASEVGKIRNEIERKREKEVD